MAKELPYFQFEPAEYLSKDISFCSLSAQGLFINICSFYWLRKCQLTKEQVLKRLSFSGELDELINEGVIDLIGDDLVIKFLDIQINNATKLSKEQSRKGKLGGRPKKPNESQTKAEEKPDESHKIREDNIKGNKIKGNKIKEDDIKEDDIKEVEIYPTFDDFWDLYDKKVGKKDFIKRKWDNLNQNQKEEIINYIPHYKKSQPEKQYRKNPETFLNNESWNDELISKGTNETKQTSNQQGGASQAYREKIFKTLTNVQSE